ncbi:hypothetical protein Sste5346_009697 [Sporothrix stenoceras]|uniref:Pentatricopeptide repeat protein n=1 Tax=Sporothrix stenoceras TaxID=5173 RepID=A0ABR3YK55_9PEZI
MTGTRIVVDGLWRCLCPSVDAPALLRAVNGGSTGRPLSQRMGQPNRQLPAIYAALRHLQDTPGAFNRINTFAQFLIEERGEPPTPALYEALVRSNCHVNGSAEAVNDMLRALKEANLEGTPSLFHGALSVLAVHPDYLLRNAVLKEMKERWIDLTPDGQHSLALGLLRDGQYERALNMLEEMTEATSTGAAPVPSWLLDIYVYVLGQEGFLDDALQIVNHRLLRDDDTVSLNIWSFLLDCCCRAGHFGGLTYVWNRVVRPGGNGLVTPSDAMALDVLNMAAQHGDANLAAATMQMLAARGTKLSMPHFEAMLDCYAQAGAIDKSLQALCIMNNAGIVPDQGSTRSIFLHLTAPAPTQPRNPIELKAAQAAVAATMESAIAALFDLKRQYGNVPIAAFNVVLESMLESHRQHTATATAMAGPKRAPALSPSGTGTEAEAGLDLYRHVRQLCPAGPNRATFRLLFKACHDPMHLNFLVREMRSFAFRPDMEMIDDVVYANATSGSLDQSLDYVYELMSEEEIKRVQSGEAAEASTSSISETDQEVVGRHSTEADIAAHADSLRRQPWISRRAAAALAKRCIEEEDPRIWAVADASRDRGRPMDNILREAMGGVKRPKASKNVRKKSQKAHNAYGVPHSVGVAEDEAPSPEEAGLSG